MAIMRERLVKKKLLRCCVLGYTTEYGEREDDLSEIFQLALHNIPTQV